MFDPVTLTHGSQKLVINKNGGGIISYDIQGNTDLRHIVYGYTNDADKVGSMGNVLFPFPGRVKDAQYEFNGVHYMLQGPYTRIKGTDAIHGFVSNQEWDVVRSDDSSVTLAISLDEKEYSAYGYPFSVRLEITYGLTDSGLEVTSVVTNNGVGEAPFGLGFHPYYRVGTEHVDEISLNLPAQARVEFTESMEPTGTLLDISSEERGRIGNRVIDFCYTSLTYEQGRAQTVISSDYDTITLWQEESFPYIQVYSSDTLAEGYVRKGLAIEPQTCTGFALNHPNMGLLTLQPGEKWEGKWGILI